MNVVDLILKFGKDNIVDYLKSAVIFFIKPKRFFTNFFQKSTDQQLLQILFYILIDIGLGLIFFEKRTVYFVLKLAIVTILHSSIAFVILYLANIACNRLFKAPTVPASNIFMFVLIMKVFYEPLFSLSKAFFEATERYELELLSNVLLVVIVFYLFVNSQNILYERLKYKIAGTLVVWFIFNGSLIAFDKLSFDKNTSFNFETEIGNALDPINAEYDSTYNSLDSLKFLDRTPYLFVAVLYKEKNKSLDTFYEFLGNDVNNIIDAKIDYFTQKRILSEVDSTSQFLKSYSKSISIIDSLTKKIRFKRNKVIFEHVKEYLYIVKDDIKNPIHDKDDSKKLRIIRGDSLKNNPIKAIIVYKCNHDFYDKRQLVMKTLNSEVETKNMSMVPTIPYMIYALPSIILTSRASMAEVIKSLDFTTDD